MFAAILGGCSDEPVQPGDTRFGEVGEIQIEVLSPVGDTAGVLDEAFLWRSDGPWVLVERMSYDGSPGGETLRQPTLNPGELAAEYASLIRELNDAPGLRLFSDDVPQDLVASCDVGRSRVILTVRDGLRDESARWERCVDGTFFTATPSTAGPDAGAARVVTALQLARFFTLGEEARSSYLGSLPFATLARGDDAPEGWDEPRFFRSQGGEPQGWREFWAEYAGSRAPLPVIDWSTEMVLLAAAGSRPEAGESMRVQRVLPTDGAMHVEIVRRLPGDFCSPAARESRPFHVVVAPRTIEPVFFGEPLVERIPCG